MPVTESVLFTSQEEVERLLSTQGLSNRLGGDAALLTYYLSEATSEVLFFIGHAGPVDILATLPWVRQCSTYHAAMAISGFGGEPVNETLAGWWKGREEKLAVILARQADVPQLAEALPLDVGSAPVVVNVRVDPQMLPSLRVVRPSSTDVPQPGVYQPIDYATRWRRRW